MFIMCIEYNTYVIKIRSSLFIPFNHLCATNNSYLFIDSFVERESFARIIQNPFHKNSVDAEHLRALVVFTIKLLCNLKILNSFNGFKDFCSIKLAK